MGPCVWRSPLVSASWISNGPRRQRAIPGTIGRKAVWRIQRRMLDAYVVGCTEREQVYQRHAQFVQDYQFWGHWAHKRRDAQGRVYYLSPEVILGQARGRVLDPLRLRRALRLRQVTRT